MDIYVWKKDYKLIHSKKAEFVEKEKRVFPIILDQCSPSLRSQLEDMKTFEEACEKKRYSGTIDAYQRIVLQA